MHLRKLLLLCLAAMPVLFLSVTCWAQDRTDPFPISGGSGIYPGALVGPYPIYPPQVPVNPFVGGGIGRMERAETDGFSNKLSDFVDSAVAESSRQNSRLTVEQIVEQYQALMEAQRPKHKPLILVKLRVIEVERNNGLDVSSVLDYVSRGLNEPSLTSGSPLNRDAAGNGFENLQGITRFAVPGLVDGAGSTAGMLVNLTTEHINYVASLLARELNGDVITAPQVTTLHGEQVAFSSGAQIPFEVGLNTIQQNTNNVVQFVYSHVGTYVEVTPQIVNWEEGGVVNPDDVGNFDPYELVTVDDIENWPGLVTTLNNSQRVRPWIDMYATNDLKDQVKKGDYPLNPTDDLKQRVVDNLNVMLRRPYGNNHQLMDRYHLSNLFGGYIKYDEPPTPGAGAGACGWNPENCTIDLAIRVYLSEGDVDPATTLTIKNNVRGINNRVQVRSGHGVVIGGLISARDIEVSNKTPILGDLPGIGALFRAKTTERSKAETLILVEAQVLPDVSQMARGQTSHDFVHGRPHLHPELNCGPMFQGQFNAGLDGPYMAPPRHGQPQYRRYYKATRETTALRRAKTSARDALCN